MPREAMTDRMAATNSELRGGREWEREREREGEWEDEGE